MQKRSPYKQRRGAAFTLVELVITMALFAMVAALVIAYVAFMSDYTERNQDNSQRSEQLTTLRMEIDRWFAWFDNADYTIELPAEGDIFLVRASAGGRNVYTLSLTLLPVETDEGSLDYQLANALCAEYPVSAPYGQEEDGLRRAYIVCSTVQSVGFTNYSADWSHTEDGSDALVLRFMIDLHVTEGTYACEIVYQ